MCPVSAAYCLCMCSECCEQYPFNEKKDTFIFKRPVEKKKKLTLTVKLADDSVQVSVLESDMTSSNRHFVAESGDFSNANSLPTATNTQFLLLVLHITGNESVTETELHGANVDAK